MTERRRMESFPLSRALGLNPGELLALCGGGGKTSLLYALAAENPFNGGLFTTTTKMFNPEGGEHPFDRILLNWTSAGSPAIAGERVFASGGILKTSKPGEPDKVTALSDRLVESWKNSCSRSILIVEADGASRKPIKYPGPDEPVIPGNTDHVAGLIGLEVLGKRPEPSLVHRAELFIENLPLDREGRISVETISALIEDSRGLFKNSPSGTDTEGGLKKSVILNKLDLLDTSYDIHRVSAVLKYRFPDIRFLAARLNLPHPVIQTV